MRPAMASVLKLITQPLNFSASHFTANDLYQARHTTDLQPRPEVILNLDVAQRGLGTASCVRRPRAIAIRN